MPSSFKGGDKLKRHLQELTQKNGGKRHVKVGFFEGATYEDGTSVAEVAAAQEFGTATIPARPFMRRTVAEKSDEWPRALAALLAHNTLTPTEALNIMGGQISSEIKDTITSIHSPPLAKSTIAARKREGSENPDKPLQDTLTLTNSVTYHVEDD